MRIPWAAAIVVCLAAAGRAEERFPPPGFESGYTLPETLVPPARFMTLGHLDLVLFVAALLLMAFLALRLRSRRGVFFLMLPCLAFFGFYRGGCVCPVGSLQNVTLALFDPAYRLPLEALVFFLIPLAVALVAGRVFCAGVCPLGAIQDAMLLKPLRVPERLAHALGVIPWVYLGLAVLFAATGGAFVVCRYDPFIAFFRLGGRLDLVALGAVFLLAAVFVGRPYCRFFCPYGALLGVCSRVSRWRVNIHPGTCIRCGLCEDACPFGAIRPPTADRAGRPRREGMGALVAVLLALPALTLVGGRLGSLATPALSRAHPVVALAEEVVGAPAPPAPPPDAVEAFGRTGEAPAALFARARGVEADFSRGGWIVGGLLGLVLGLKILARAVRRRRAGFEADRAACLSCGRCYRACPGERERLRALREGTAP